MSTYLLPKVNSMNENEQSRGRILVADDEFTVRYAVRTVLENAGFEVVEAQDGLEALSVMAASAIDVALIDIIMPNIEGSEAISHIHHDYPAVAVVAISGGGRGQDFDHLERARSLGAKAVLRKPFTEDQLLDAVTRVQDGDG